MYVCMYVCMHAFACVCVFLCIYVLLCSFVSLGKQKYMCLRSGQWLFIKCYKYVFLQTCLLSTFFFWKIAPGCRPQMIGNQKCYAVWAAAQLWMDASWSHAHTYPRHIPSEHKLLGTCESSCVVSTSGVVQKLNKHTTCPYMVVSKKTQPILITQVNSMTVISKQLSWTFQFM